MTRTSDRVACLAAASSVTCLTLVGALLALTAGPARGADGGWRWPLDPPPRVLDRFDAPAGPYAAGHRGADLEARVGQPVRAAGAGVVAFAGPVAGRDVVSLLHADGRRTTYEPVSATASRGDPVRAGDPLGVVTAAPGHCLPRTCLHWGLRLGERYLDPLSLVGSTRVRLLPVWAPLAPTWSGWSRVAPWAPAVGSRGVPGVAAAPAWHRDRGPLIARGLS